MGADGHWYIVRRVDFEAAFPGEAPPPTLGQCEVLGVSALTGYEDTEDRSFSCCDWGLCVYHRAEMHTARAQHAPRPRGPQWDCDEEARLAEEARAHPGYPGAKRTAEMIKWFREHAEEHTVWT